ncbi:protein rtoA-like [Artemia franciscana]|uniref:protein rtoA-like n=1 Tax=Artemia franciscana TaxID=6661 RepID=UPI0032DAAA27
MLPTYQIGDRIRVILDLEENTLAFEINDKFLGVAFRGLPKKRLFPAVCGKQKDGVDATSVVSMVYLGSHFNVGRSEVQSETSKLGYKVTGPVVLSSTSDSSSSGSSSSSNSSSGSDLNPLCSTSESSSSGSRSSSNSGSSSNSDSDDFQSEDQGATATTKAKTHEGA